MNFPLWFSNRIRLNAGGEGANATGMAIAIAGVSLALIIMECTLAIVSGFKSEITDRVMGFEGQITVLPAYDYNTAQSDPYIADADSITSLIAQALPGAVSVVKMHQPGILKTPTDFAGVYFVGYGPDYDYAFEGGNVVEGQLPDFADADRANCIMLSQQTADALGLELGDKVDACFFVNDAIKSRRFEIASIYNSGFSEYDKTTVFAPIGTLQKIAGADSVQGTSISVYLPSYDNISDQAARLQNSFLQKYQTGQWAEIYPVDNVEHTGALFFNWLKLLDTNVVVIFILMSCVAGFTLVSSMFILILDHIPTIGLLRSLGATGSQIRLIFTNMAMKIVFWGIIMGNTLGIGLLLCQQHFKFFRLNPEMYYLPYVPVQINWWWFVLLNVAVMIVAWCLLVMPAKAASKVSPTETLNYD